MVSPGELPGQGQGATGGAPAAVTPPAPSRPAISTSPTLRGPGSPDPAKVVPTLPPGPRAALQGGTQVAAATPYAPAVGAGSAPSAAVPGDVSAIVAGMQGDRATPATGVQTAQNYPPAGTAGSPIIQTPAGPVIQAGPPAGYSTRLQQDQEGYNADQRALVTHNTNVTNLDTALEALKLTDTGRSTGAVHNFYSFLSSQGIAPNFVDNDVTQYDIARKAMMAFAASRAGAAGTDLARVQSELSNASPEISQAASRHVLLQNLGLENMEIAANRAQDDRSGAGYGENKANFYRDYDSRGFAWDRYSDTERGAIQAELAQRPAALAKLRASVQKAMDMKIVTPPSKQQSQAAPATNGAPTNAAPPANALAAATPANAATANALAA